MSDILGFIEKMSSNDISRWEEKIPVVREEYKKLTDLLYSENPPFIYGVNSLVGHMDFTHVSSDEVSTYQKKLLENHYLDLGYGYYNEFQVHCIFYAKLSAISNGGTGVSTHLFEEMLRVYHENEYQIKIPVFSSYSCGDVIPGTHFALGLMPYLHEYEWVDKDAISMINGNYVSIGLSLALLPRLLSILDHLIENTVQLFQVLPIDENILYIDSLLSPFAESVFETIRRTSAKRNITEQPSVSLRAALKNIDLFYTVIRELEEEIQVLLREKSDNPILCEDGKIRSNSSFYSPKLSIRLSAVIDTILYLAWNTERHLHYILSGNVQQTTINFSNQENPLGLIQVPKLVTNILQNMRTFAGTRWSATTLETSYGIEDSYSCAALLVSQIETLMNDFDTILSIENEVLLYYHHGDYDRFRKGFHASRREEPLKSSYPLHYVKDLL